MTITCGIDWVEKHHDVTLVDEDGRVIVHYRSTSAPGCSSPWCCSCLTVGVSRHCEGGHRCAKAPSHDTGQLQPLVLPQLSHT